MRAGRAARTAVRCAEKLRKRATPLNYEAFCRRRLEGQNNSEVATALGLSRKAAQRRYERVVRTWESLTDELAVIDAAAMSRVLGVPTDEGYFGNFFKILTVPPKNLRGIFDFDG